MPQHWACMYALCVAGAVNIQGYVWKFLCVTYKFSFMRSFKHLKKKKKVVCSNRPFITTFTSNNLSNFISLCTFCDLCCLGVRCVIYFIYYYNGLCFSMLPVILVYNAFLFVFYLILCWARIVERWWPSKTYEHMHGMRVYQFILQY